MTITKLYYYENFNIYQNNFRSGINCRLHILQN